MSPVYSSLHGVSKIVKVIKTENRVFYYVILLQDSLKTGDL